MPQPAVRCGERSTAVAYFRLGETSEAIAQFKEALRLQADDAAAAENLRFALATEMRRRAESRSCLCHLKRSRDIS
jgi:Flp pilus assembly protein TadD